MKSSPSQRTLTFLSVFIVAAFLFSSIFSYYTTKSRLREEITNSSLPLLGENIYSEILQALSLPLNISSAISKDSFLVNWVENGEQDEEEITHYLAVLQDKYGFFTTFFVSDKTYKYYYNGGVHKEISEDDAHDVWYFSFIESGRESDLDVDTNEAENQILTVFINYRLENQNGDFLGVVGVGIQLEQLAEMLEDKQNRYNRIVYLVDENGILQVHSDLSMIEKINLFEEEGISKIAHEILIPHVNTIDTSYENNNETFLISSRYIPEMGWYVIVEQKESESYKLVRRTLYVSLFMTLLVASILLMGSFKILKKFETYMEDLAGTDKLTNAANRREMEKYYHYAVERNKRYSNPFSLLIIDLDNFKNINDSLGHIIGDRVLVDLSNQIRKIIRPGDLLARWGGDEFIVLLESDLSDSQVIAERIRCASAELGREYLNDLSVTVSLGLTVMKQDDTLQLLIKRADKALYQSKQMGKNCLNISKNND